MGLLAFWAGPPFAVGAARALWGTGLCPRPQMLAPPAPPQLWQPEVVMCFRMSSQERDANAGGFQRPI